MTVRPISKRAARLAGISVGMFAVVCALLWLWLGEPESSGPLIRGKLLTHWTQQLRAGRMDPAALSALASEKAVAIPALVEQLSLRDSAAKDFAKRLWRRLPAMLRARLPEPTTHVELREGAAFALYIFFHPGDEPALSEAQIMLPALTKALQDREPNVRLFATMALDNLDVMSGPAIESCAVALKDPHWRIRQAAAYSLGHLASGDERAITCLKSALTDSRPEVRKVAAEQLGILGIALPRDEVSSATNRIDRR